MANETPTPTMISNPFHLAHAISNIKALIPVTLDIKNPNYQKWSHFFIITAGRFCLTDLLLGKEKPANISADEWQRADYLLQTWIYGTITEDLSSMVLSKTAMAHDLWKALASLFTDNKDYRAIQLEEQFKSLKKGSLEIHDYCQLLKTTADNLADVSNPVSDKQLVLQTLHGLPKHYGTIVNLISFQTPLPSFLQTRSLLQMEEHRIAEPEQTPTVLYASRPNSSNSWYMAKQDPTPGHSSTAYNYPPQQHVNCSNSSSNSGPLQPTNLATHLNTLTLQSSSEPRWFMDMGASSHMAPHSGNFHFIFNPSNNFPKNVIVGNGSTVPILKIGHTILPSTPFRLTNVYVTPHIIKNLVSVRKFTRDNSCSVEFDPYGFSVKDLHTRAVILRCNSSGDLYPIGAPSPSPSATALLAHTTPVSSTWHRRLGHPGNPVMTRLFSSNFISSTKDPRESICNACQLGKHSRLPFFTSHSITVAPFEIIHADLWTSPISSISDFKYYLVLIDDFTHYT
ncbi:PREDICTED: uncharacterized protein LOC105967747 [Erythranthe guttata]|uniref:uncharacterized protein LOC105967747 n=1 Tax=Erythranthe guttata TaxID=4155 RepID=UPI00064D808A|nr:PREDICTED: uncharacterized protein LOC105967747 [Erythranthe guttata]|eukprot:XP_012847817.1 PREDICTED: uncharacterized protein LOC105967747 [Erythranthe guttata]